MALLDRATWGGRPALCTHRRFSASSLIPASPVPATATALRPAPKPLKLSLNHLYVLFSHHGAIGLLILGFLDSSFLFVPLGNDLLIIAMSARKHILIPYYALMATAGSVLGCLTVDILVLLCYKK